MPVGNILLLAVDHIEVDRIAAVAVGGIHHLLLPYLSVLSYPILSRVVNPSNRDTGLGRGDILVIVKLPRQRNSRRVRGRLTSLADIFLFFRLVPWIM